MYELDEKANERLRSQIDATRELRQVGYRTLTEADNAALNCNLLDSHHKHSVMDSGPWCHPRYHVQVIPAIGDPVSYGFNGDCYPCGYVVKISKNRIETSGAVVFNRQIKSNKWRRDKTWSLVLGHRYSRNPEF